MIKVYVAAPYTKPDPAINVHKVVKVADKLFELGYIPYVPHLTHLWHLISPKDISCWYQIDMEFLRTCDCVLRLPGESIGADNEVAEAYRLGIPVFLSIEELNYSGILKQKNLRERR